MQLIDRYILKLFFLYLAAGLVVFVTLDVAVEVLSFGLRNADVGTGPLIRYFSYHVPWVFYQLMPLACLMSTLFTLSSLNKTNELTALYSLGMGLTRIATTILLAVAVLSVVGLAFADQILPPLM